MTKDSYGEIIKEMRINQEKYQQNWMQELLPGIRVFCVTEERDNLLMWAHYAKDHTGAVFELWSLPEEDNPLSVAHPVEYQENPPTFFTQAEWIDDLTGIKTLDVASLSRRYAYTKSKHWEYEREWRVWYPYSPQGSLYDDMSLRQSEFSAIYFGCKADPKFMKDAIELIRTAFPAVRVFHAQKVPHAYALEYKEI